MSCRICKGELHDDYDVGEKWNEWMRKHSLCHTCRTLHGLSADARPSTRPLEPCTRCGHTQLVRMLLRERTGEYSTLVPMALTYHLVTDPSFWSGKQAHAPDQTMPLGVLDAWVCRGCGFTELFAREPEQIPIGIEHGTELVDVTKASPFR